MHVIKQPAKKCLINVREEYDVILVCVGHADATRVGDRLLACLHEAQHAHQCTVEHAGLVAFARFANRRTALVFCTRAPTAELSHFPSSRRHNALSRAERNANAPHPILALVGDVRSRGAVLERRVLFGVDEAQL
jgi:hypothetical protein